LNDCVIVDLNLALGFLEVLGDLFDWHYEVTIELQNAAAGIRMDIYDGMEWIRGRGWADWLGKDEAISITLGVGSVCLLLLLRAECSSYKQACLHIFFLSSIDLVCKRVYLRGSAAGFRGWRGVCAVVPDLEASGEGNEETVF
jgi:hypothetical protein